MLSFVRSAARGISVLGVVALAMPAGAQQPAPALPTASPHVAVTARGEARVVPDRALLHVAVETRANTAVAAASENARTQTKVIEAIKGAGIPSAQIRTSGYNVYPDQQHGPRGEVRVTGYRAHNMVTVEVNGVENVAKVIDAALGAGANNVNSAGLFAANAEAARQEALKNAVAKAREEAEAIASAAGGTLGALVEVGTPTFANPREMVAVTATGGMLQAANATPIEAGERVVVAVIHARWQFVPNQR